MKRLFYRLKSWYEDREPREQGLIIILGWAILYAFFYYVLFNSLEYRNTMLSAELDEERQQSAGLDEKIKHLQDLAQSPLYTKWVAQQEALKKLQSQYNYILQASSADDWVDVVNTVLHSKKDVELQQIKNLPETQFNVSIDNSKKIYQQQLSLSVRSKYSNTINYLQELEKELPYVHWDKLDYKVTQYPWAVVDLEFSILYEKDSS